MAMFLRGWALAAQGQGEEGVAQMWQALTDALATGASIVRPMCLTLLAEAYGREGQVDQGLRILAEGLAVSDQGGARYYEAEGYRLKGELLLQQDVPDTAQAETCFHYALAIAYRQQAKSWELRAAMSLAHLWQRQGKRKAAYNLLAPVYGWFTEGFDTADLQEAKALLEQLGA
jgi:predicted ATPase